MAVEKSLAVGVAAVMYAGATLTSHALAHAVGPIWQGQVVVARIHEGRAVFVVDAESGRERGIYEYDLSRGWLHDLSVAPSGKYIAIIETARQGSESGLPRNRLLILNPAGGVVETIGRDVRRYTWCCDGETIAYIVGAYREDGLQFTPDGSYLYRIEARSEVPLALPKSSYEIQWASFDSSLYVRTASPIGEARVWRYNLFTGQVSPTPYGDIRFSPSGTYYLHYNLLDPTARVGWHIVERATGRDLAPPDTSLGAIVGWAFGSGDRLLLARGKPTSPCPSKKGLLRACDFEIVGYVVYDVRATRVVKRLEGRLIQDGAASNGALPIRKGGVFELVSDPGS